MLNLSWVLIYFGDETLLTLQGLRSHHRRVALHGQSRMQALFLYIFELLLQVLLVTQLVSHLLLLDLLLLQLLL